MTVNLPIVTLHVVYVVNGSTQSDELKASEISFQREGDVVTVRFPHSDGQLTGSTALKVEGLRAVSYAKADRVLLVGACCS